MLDDLDRDVCSQAEQLIKAVLEEYGHEIVKREFHDPGMTLLCHTKDKWITGSPLEFTVHISYGWKQIK